jgi:hypothetical protein
MRSGPPRLVALIVRVLPIFRFSQVEVPWLLGPPDGRYLLRRDRMSGDRRTPGDNGDGSGRVSPDAKPEPTHVLLFATVSAERRRSRRPARQRVAPPTATDPTATAVPVQRVTVIGATSPFTDEAAARRWLGGAGEGELAKDLMTLGAVLHTFGAVTADPHVRAPGRDELLVARIGYGEGEQVAHGKWTDARDLLAAAPRRKRSKVLEPQARLAAALGQRTPPLLCEDLVLRARSDLDGGRPRAAALQLTVALNAALTELGPQMAVDMAARIAELAAQLEPISDAAATALRGELTHAELDTVSVTLARIEAALRARAVAAA